MKRSAQVTSARAIALSGVSLLALASGSFVLSSFHLGALGLSLALAIAVVKGFIVVMVFMELAREHVSIRLAALAASVMLLLLVSLMTADVLTREVAPLGSRLPDPPRRPTPAWVRH